MIDKLIVPTETADGLTAPIAEHFGRAPFFTVVELGDKWEITNVTAVENVSEHMGGVGVPPDHLVKLHPKAIAVFGMGPKGIMAFKNAGVEVLKATGSTVNEVVEAYKQGKLSDLTEGCQDAHHHH